jgi:hypothetical protein
MDYEDQLLFSQLEQSLEDVAPETQPDQGFTQVVVNALPEFSRNVGQYAAGGRTKQEETTRKTVEVATTFSLPVNGQEVAEFFQDKLPEVFHLLNPTTMIYTYIKLTRDYKKMTINNFEREFDLPKERVIDILRYIHRLEQQA